MLFRSGQHPTFDINAAWVQCDQEPGQPVKFPIITADGPVQVNEGGRSGNQVYRKHQNAKMNAAPATTTKTRNSNPQPEDTGISRPNQGYRAYEKREEDSGAGVETQDNIRGSGQVFREPRKANLEQAELQGRNSQGRTDSGQREWQERFEQVYPGTKIIIDSRYAKGEVKKRELSKEEIMAMQDKIGRAHV